MLSPRHERLGFTSLFVASSVAFGTGFVLTVLPLVTVGFFGALGAVLWGVWATSPKRATPAPGPQPGAPREAAVPFEVVEPAGETPEVTFHVVDAAPPARPSAPAAASNPLPWARPAPVARASVGAAGAMVAAVAPKPEWARPTGSVGGTSRTDANASRYNPLSGPVTRGLCGKCRTPITLSARRPIRATCPVCGHSRVLE